MRSFAASGGAAIRAMALTDTTPHTLDK
jgi:hypothetical protein